MSLKNDLVESINDLLDDVFNSDKDEYPEEAVPIGTYVRSKKWDLLGVVTEAFYGEVNNQKVIIYTVLYFPYTKPGSYYLNITENFSTFQNSLFVDSEVEFDLTFFLMIPPMNMEEITIYNHP